MKRLVAIQAELIRGEAAGATTLRRRLLAEHSGKTIERIAVRVTELAPHACTIACPQPVCDVDGKLWLSIPGLEAFQIAAIDESEGSLICLFAQPLSNLAFESLTSPPAQHVRTGSFRPRCSFLK